MKKTILSTVILTLISTIMLGQIKLPENFICHPEQKNLNESYFSDVDGNYLFISNPWGDNGLKGQELINFLQTNLYEKFKYTKTPEGLYLSTGNMNGYYFYSILVNESIEFTLKSKTEGRQFSDYSALLLRQIQTSIKENKEIIYTDYLGKNCN